MRQNNQKFNLNFNILQSGETRPIYQPFNPAGKKAERVAESVWRNLLAPSLWLCAAAAGCNFVIQNETTPSHSHLSIRPPTPLASSFNPYV
jgi:hypothetical protein